MSECYDSIANVVIPLTILNFVGTAVIILISRCTERWWILGSSHFKPESCYCNKLNVSRISPDIDSQNDDDDVPDELAEDILPIETDLIKPIGVDDEIQMETKNFQTDDAVIDESETPDVDLIAQVRASTQSECVSSPGVVPDIIESDRVLSTRNELSGEQASLETMAGTLISVTKNIAGALDNASHIPKEKKDELASLLKGVPGFISKIVDMDDDQLNALLSGNKPNIKEESSRGNGSITDCNRQSDHSNRNIIMKTHRALAEDHKKESDYLMKTLDSLRR